MKSKKLLVVISIILLVIIVLLVIPASREALIRVYKFIIPGPKLLDIKRSSPPPIKGWYDWQGKRYYYLESEKQLGWQRIKEDWYYFDGQGHMTRGWLELRGATYYLNPQNGQRLDGWQDIQGKTYYLSPGTGRLKLSSWIEDEGEHYYLTGDGSPAYGWLEQDGLFYMDPENGSRLEGLQIIEEESYYFEPGTGRLETAQWLELDGENYYLKDDGRLARGWLELEDSFYLDPKSGVRLEGFQTIEDKLYYLEPGSGMLMVSQWLELEGEKYYLTEDGSPARGRTSTPDGDYLFDNKSCLLLADLSRPVIHLSYDDGPSKLTPELLDFLDKENVKVSFFYQGMMIPGNEEIVKRAYEAGHSIGNHSYNHPTFTKLSREEIAWQIEKTDSLIEAITGHKAAWFRSPYGATNQSVLKNVGKPTIHWNIDSEDWLGYSPEELKDELLKEAKDGAIIIMHDTHKNTIEASKLLIPELKKEGYQIVNLEVLFKVKGVEAEAGQVYFGI